METITLTAGRFSVDDLTPYFDGSEEPGKFWNGWRMPFFTEPVMQQIKTYIESAPGWGEGDDATIIEHNPDQPPAERFTVSEGGYISTVPAVEVNGTWLWQLGDGWCWTAEDLRPAPPVPAPEYVEMAADDREAVRVAVQRELQPGSISWGEIKDLTLADLASRNQDALIDDLFEDHPGDRPHRAEIAALVAVYDRLLGTSRAAELEGLDAAGGTAEDHPANAGAPAEDLIVRITVRSDEIDHAQCPPGSHTFDAGDEHYEGRVDEHGNQLCNDCGVPMFYCTVDNRYHHVQRPDEADVEPCFLIQEQAWRIPAPQPGDHGYELVDDQWICIRHEETCPPLDTDVLTRATAYPEPPEPETCYCGGKVRYGRCRECDTLYGQREDNDNA